MKKGLIIGLLLVAIAGAAYGLREWKPRSTVVREDPNRKTTAVVERRTIRFEIRAAGDVGPAEQVSVRPEINGRIEVLPVDIGDRVKKGSVLFTLDDKDLQIERSSRQTEIERTKLQLEKARRNDGRAKELIANNLISKEAFEDAHTEFELARNSLERAEKELRLTEERLTKTRIYAPFDCTILTRPVSVGQAVSGSGGFNSGTEVLTIADLNQMIVSAHINQADVTRLSQGQEVAIQVESVPGLKLKGLVDRIAPQSTLKNGIRGYPARISLKTLDTRVLPGMTANLTIPIASTDNALSVPLAAVFTEQGERFAFVKKGDSFERRPLEVGVNDYDFAEVLSGAHEGDVVSLETPRGETLGKAAGPAGSGTNRTASGTQAQSPRTR